VKMSRPINNISSLDKLNQEKQQLRAYCTYQEKLITYKLGELKKNFPEIISNEILPFTKQKNIEITSMLDVVNDFILRFLPTKYRNNRFAPIVLKLLQVILIRGLSKRSEKVKVKHEE
jgi:hypothetical protein